jgi:hypothetical protein
MAVSTDPQLAMDERALNHPDLEQALERHLRAKDDVAELRGTLKNARKKVDALIETIADFEPDTALRIGRFRITKRHVEGGHVEFDKAARDQISIGLVDADGAPAKRAAKPKLHSVSDDEDLRPSGPVNADALRGDAERSIIQ